MYNQHISPVGPDGTESACSVGDLGLILGLGRSRGGGHDNTSCPVVLPGESCGQRSLAGYSPWDRKESDMTDRLSRAHST